MFHSAISHSTAWNRRFWRNSGFLGLRQAFGTAAWPAVWQRFSHIRPIVSDRPRFCRTMEMFMAGSRSGPRLASISSLQVDHRRGEFDPVAVQQRRPVVQIQRRRVVAARRHDQIQGLVLVAGLEQADGQLGRRPGEGRIDLQGGVETIGGLLHADWHSCAGFRAGNAGRDCSGTFPDGVRGRPGHSARATGRRAEPAADWLPERP